MVLLTIWRPRLFFIRPLVERSGLCYDNGYLYLTDPKTLKNVCLAFWTLVTVGRRDVHIVVAQNASNFWKRMQKIQFRREDVIFVSYSSFFLIFFLLLIVFLILTFNYLIPHAFQSIFSKNKFFYDKIVIFIMKK